MKAILRELSRALLTATLIVCAGTGVVIASGGSGAGVITTLTGLVTGDRLTLTSTSGGAFTATAAGTGTAISGIAGASGGVGVAATNLLNGYALTVSPDTTSPTTAAIHIDTANNNPSLACSLGDFFVRTTGVMRGCLAAAGTSWTSVSNMGITFTIAAAGTDQATATAINTASDWATITGADGVKGITLPQGSVAECKRVMSQVTAAANTLLVYGHNSDNDTINGAAADAAYVQMAGTSLTYCTTDGTAWFTY